MKTTHKTNQVFQFYLDKGVEPSAASTLTLADAINRLASKIEFGIPDAVGRGIREALLHSDEFSDVSETVEMKTHSK